MSEELNPGLNPEVGQYLEQAAQLALQKKNHLAELSREAERQEAEKNLWKSRG